MQWTLVLPNPPSIKLYLKTPEIDGVGLLQGLRPFILKLDEDKNKRNKICKTYDSLALNNISSVKITSEGFASKEWFEMFERIVEESFLSGTEYEITNMQKKRKPICVGCGIFTGASSTDEGESTHLQQRNLGREARR